MQTIGDRVRAVREEMMLTQRDLASPEDGLSYSYIASIEAGVRSPSRHALEMLARSLGVTALYLESGHGEHQCPHCHAAVAV